MFPSLIALLLIVLKAECAELEITKWTKFLFLVVKNSNGQNTETSANWTALMDKSFVLRDYSAVSTSVQANYISLLGGDDFDCGYSDTICSLPMINVIDLLETKGISWGMYDEAYVTSQDGCNLDLASWDDYIRNPFLSYQSITSNPSRCARIKTHTELKSEIRSNKLPQFSFVTLDTRNIANRAQYISQFLSQWWNPYQFTAWRDTLLMVTFDHNPTYESKRVLAFFKASCGLTGFSDVEYNHFSVLRFIEDNWDLGNLGQRDVDAPNFGDEVKCAAHSYKKFFFMMFENRGYSYTTSNSYWKAIINESLLLTGYYGVTHPSQPNYIASLGGSYFGCTSDSSCLINQTNLVTLLEAKGVDWKMYAEDYYPGSNGACSWSNSGQYSRSHNPFLAFMDISYNYTRCQKITTHYQFVSDVENNALPRFSYYTPNNNNNSHDQGLDYSGAYLTRFLNTWYYPYADTTWKETLLMITFDEDSYADNNRVVAFFKSPCNLKGTADGYYNHYSMLRYVEDMFELGTLGRNDSVANTFAQHVKCDLEELADGDQEAQTDLTAQSESNPTSQSDPNSSQSDQSDSTPQSDPTSQSETTPQSDPTSQSAETQISGASVKTADSTSEQDKKANDKYRGNQEAAENKIDDKYTTVASDEAIRKSSHTTNHYEIFVIVLVAVTLLLFVGLGITVFWARWEAANGERVKSEAGSIYTTSESSIPLSSAPSPSRNYASYTEMNARNVERGFSYSPSSRGIAQTTSASSLSSSHRSSFKESIYLDMTVHDAK